MGKDTLTISPPEGFVLDEMIAPPEGFVLDSAPESNQTAPTSLSDFDPNKLFDQAKKTVDLAVQVEIPVNAADNAFWRNTNIKEQFDKTHGYLETGDGPFTIEDLSLARIGQAEQDIFRILGLSKPLPPDMLEPSPARTLKEIVKGPVRGLEYMAGQIGGTAPEWMGDFIEFGGQSLDKFVKVGEKHPDQIYNPIAGAIIAAGQRLSMAGKKSREAWVWDATHGFEAIDPVLKDQDPISYYAGAITEAMPSSALSVLAMWLSGGTSEAASLLSAGSKINRGLIALSTISAAAGYGHAKEQKENFLWSTVHGLADGGIEYFFEQHFLQGINVNRWWAAIGEGVEEIYTGLFQNTRAGILEKVKKGIPIYEAAKEAVAESLRKAPIEFAGGVLGGLTVIGGDSMFQIAQRALAAPIEIETVEPSKAQIPIVSDEKYVAVKARIKVEKAPGLPVGEQTPPGAPVTTPPGEIADWKSTINKLKGQKVIEVKLLIYGDEKIKNAIEEFLEETLNKDFLEGEERVEIKSVKEIC